MPKLRKKPTNIEIYNAKQRSGKFSSSKATGQTMEPSFSQQHFESEVPGECGHTEDLLGQISRGESRGRATEHSFPQDQIELEVPGECGHTEDLLGQIFRGESRGRATEPSFPQDQIESEVPGECGHIEEAPCLLSTSKEKEEFNILGRRIVNVGYIFDQFCKANMHSVITGCSISNLKLQGESRNGLKSIFQYECNMCGYKFLLHTDPQTPEAPSINDDVVLAGAATGIGFTQIEEFLSGLDVPSMSKPTFLNIQEGLVNRVEEVSAESYLQAAQEEKQYALDNGNVDEDGVPIITVVLDGMWAKRSYGTMYNSGSGCATIIGYHTKKVLFMGVRNKRCYICDRAQNAKIHPPAHKCYKNYVGSSGGMESDAILEGFKTSEEMYGIRYKYFIGDGDSNSYKKIIEAKPYGESKVIKIECYNHLLRNYRRKIAAFLKNTQIPLKARKILKPHTARFSINISCAVKYRRMEEVSRADKEENLRKDILNVPLHILGNHANCADYYVCKKIEKPDLNGKREKKSVKTKMHIETKSKKKNGNPDLKRKGDKKILEKSDVESQVGQSEKSKSLASKRKTEKIPLKKNVDTDSKAEYSDYFRDCGALESLLKIHEQLASHSSSLIHKMNSNSVESFHNLIAKHVGGKRTDLTKRGTYGMRCKLATVRHNTRRIYSQVQGCTTELKRKYEQRPRKISVKRRKIIQNSKTKNEEKEYGHTSDE